MKSAFLSLFCITLLLFSFGLSGSIAQNANKKLAVDILVLINRHRAEMNLPPLSVQAPITAAAEHHSFDMATGKVPFGHNGFDARMAGISKQLKNATSWAENVASGANTAEKVVDMWLHSPVHKENIEGDYNLTGIGIAKGDDGTLYYTQIFFKTGSSLAKPKKR